MKTGIVNLVIQHFTLLEVQKSKEHVESYNYKLDNSILNYPRFRAIFLESTCKVQKHD